MPLNWFRVVLVCGMKHFLCVPKGLVLFHLRIALILTNGLGYSVHFEPALPFETMHEALILFCLVCATDDGSEDGIKHFLSQVIQVGHWYGILLLSPLEMVDHIVQAIFLIAPFPGPFPGLCISDFVNAERRTIFFIKV